MSNRSARQVYRAGMKRKARAQRRIEQFGSAAIVKRSKARSTGTTVVVEDTAHHDAVADPDGGRWATICEDHGGVVNHDTQAIAQSFASCPEEWCPDCQEENASR